MGLIPTLREKKRYVVFEVMGNTRLSFNEVFDRINNAVLLLIGELGFSKAGIVPVAFEGNKGVMKVSHTHVQHARAALALADSLQIRSVGVSGTLEKVKKKYFGG